MMDLVYRTRRSEVADCLIAQVGPTGGGKTTLARALAEAMTKLRAAGHRDQVPAPALICPNPDERSEMTDGRWTIGHLKWPWV